MIGTYTIANDGLVTRPDGSQFFGSTEKLRKELNLVHADSSMAAHLLLTKHRAKAAPVQDGWELTLPCGRTFVAPTFYGALALLRSEMSEPPVTLP